MMSNDQLTEEKFWEILTAPALPAAPVVYRLYHNDQGEPLFYSTEDLPGNYIEIDQITFANSPTNIRVKDGKLAVIKTAVVSKLVPSDTGTACHPQDVSVIVNDTSPNIKWKLK